MIKDFVETLKLASLTHLKYGRYAFFTIEDLLHKYQLADNPAFLDFIDEQLLITAQNHRQEVNALFGAAALCYTNFTNCYVDGGLMNLVQPFVNYIKEKGGELILRDPILKVTHDGRYNVQTKKDSYSADYFISGLPINNTIDLYPGKYRGSITQKLLPSEKLNSAFQMGIGFRSDQKFESIHHQIHLQKPLAGTESKSIFVSINHPDDHSRCDLKGMRVASVSTHLKDPENHFFDKETTEKEVIAALEGYGILKKEDMIYQHASAQKSWEKWTGRAFGFVGGYPQFKNIKPWQMIDARLDGHKAYICGDTAYPGQEIPGVTLSGIIAAHKLKQDWL
ncbi:MAG: FAD-dependent oxidoreductase [Bacteroidota bacterium]